MPTQVVNPSVSLAVVLHGTAFTVFVEIPSSPTLSKPVVLLGRNAVPGAGAAPTVADGAVPAAGGSPSLPIVCCPNAEQADRARIATTENVILSRHMEISLKL
jgi:hypothetical protein